MYAYMYVCMYACVSVCGYVCMYVCMCVFTNRTRIQVSIDAGYEKAFADFLQGTPLQHCFSHAASSVPPPMNAEREEGFEQTNRAKRDSECLTYGTLVDD